MKIILSIALSSLLLSALLSKPVQIKTKSFFCYASNKSISSNYKCFAKSFSREISTCNIAMNFTRKMFDMRVRQLHFHFYLWFKKSFFPQGTHRGISTSHNQTDLQHNVQHNCELLYIHERNRNQHRRQIHLWCDCWLSSKRFFPSMSVHRRVCCLQCYTQSGASDQPIPSWHIPLSDDSFWWFRWQHLYIDIQFRAAINRVVPKFMCELGLLNNKF